MLTLRSTALSFALGAILLSLSACGPTYPECETDEHCLNNPKGRKEVCANRFCKQCRTDDHCGEGQICSSNACTYKVGYCDETRPCEGKEKCRNNECGPECTNNSECEANEYCDNSSSCAVKPQCGEFADNPSCPAGAECEAGKCVERIVECTSDPVYFEFAKYEIKEDGLAKIGNVATCLKGNNVAPIVLDGHADELGDDAYNMALSEDRGKAVFEVLERFGVDVSIISIKPHGEHDPAVPGGGAQPKNRRVEFRPVP